RSVAGDKLICCAKAGKLGQSAGSMSRKCLRTRAERLLRSLYFTKKLAGAFRRKRFMAASSRILRISRYLASKEKPECSCSNCTLSENRVLSWALNGGSGQRK